MGDAGYGPEARLAVDDDYLAFAQHFRRMQAATKMVNAPQPKKGEKPQVPAPLHSEAELLAELDLKSGEQSSDIVAGMLADRPLDEREWDALDAQDGS